MIDKKNLENLLLKQLEKENLVLVETKISSGNAIKVFIDSLSGVPISKCIQISRFIEQHLDREAEDFELEVSSYGITSPFILPLHYKKNIGRKVEVQTADMSKPVKGILHSAEFTENDTKLLHIEILQTKKLKQADSKKKIETEEIFKIKESEIKQVKLISII